MATPVAPPKDGPALDRALLNSSQLPILLFDDQLKVVFATRAFCADFELLREDIDGKPLAELGDGEWNIPQLRLLLDNAAADGPPMGDYETNLARKGFDPRCLMVNVQNLDHDGSKPVRVLMTINDVTHARAVERQYASLLLEKDNLLRERAILLQEMQHRVANSLQIIASVLLLKAKTVKSEETRLHLTDAHDRVMSVAAVQQHLQPTSGDVEIGPYLVKLCESLAASMIRESRPLAIRVKADASSISSHDAVSLGLVVTELVINSLKHGFPESRSGHIDVDYRVQPAGWILSVTDNGVGRSTASLTAKVGLGTSLVDALADQLGGRVVHIDADPGVRVEIIRD